MDPRLGRDPDSDYDDKDDTDPQPCDALQPILDLISPRREPKEDRLKRSAGGTAAC